MKAQKHYEVDEEILEAYEKTEKTIRELDPKDRLATRADCVDIMTSIVHQCQYIAQTLMVDDLMVSMPLKEYTHLFEGLRGVALELTSVSKDFTKRVPSLSEDVKLQLRKNTNPLVK